MNMYRASGILLHPTSLPTSYGIGEIGAEAYEFVDFLVESKQSLWQIFPLGPTGYGDSPYQSFSAFAGNPLLISIDELKNNGYISVKDLRSLKNLPADHVDFGSLIPLKYEALKKAWQNFKKSNHSEQRASFDQFRSKESYWLDDFALFMTLKHHNQGKVWTEWEAPFRNHNLDALENFSEEFRDEIEFHAFLQYLFESQWRKLKQYANQRNIKIIGDLPIFVSHDSSDTWSHRELFYLDSHGQPEVVAGVPPDYFSRTGQLWGNPHYRWDTMQNNGFRWWISRFRQLFENVDIVRVDHFRGFEAYWEVPGNAATAEHGRWVKAPGEALFRALLNELGKAPIIAEDLGFITPEVHALRRQFGFPGMKILQFAFDSGPNNPFLPHNFTQNCVVFTGTHDNDTTLGWYRSLAKPERKNVLAYFNSSGENICWDMIRAAFSSTAHFAIVPLQDLLQLDTTGRMNFPGRLGGNWSWRYLKKQIKPSIARELSRLAAIYGRIV